MGGECGASEPLMTHSADAVSVGANSRRRRRPKDKTNCTEDRDSISSLPSTLAAYIREEHKHSGGTDRCLTDSHSYL